MRGSKRLAVETSESPWAQRVAKARAAGSIAWDLTCTNPVAVGFVPQPEQWVDAYARAATTYEPAAHGLLAAREAIAAYYAEKHISVQPSQLHLAAGTSELYSALLLATCDPGDAVLVPRPSYPLLEWLARFSDVHVLPYSLTYDGEWHVDLNEVAELMTPRVKAVIAIAPNNPTGQFLRRSEWQGLDRLCAAHETLLIVDEVFADDCWRPLAADKLRSALSVAGATSATTVVLSGLSKVAALPQMKLAWAALTGRSAKELLTKLELIGDTYLSAATPTQAIAGQLLESSRHTRSTILRRLAANHEHLGQMCRATAVTALSVEAGWSAMLRLPNVKNDADWAECLLEAGVLVQPGYFYDCEGGPFLVLSLLTPPPVFSAGVGALLALTAATVK